MGDEKSNANGVSPHLITRKSSSTSGMRVTLTISALRFPIAATTATFAHLKNAFHEGVRPHDFHGKIGADGSFFDMRGNYIDNLNYHR